MTLYYSQIPTEQGLRKMAMVKMDFEPIFCRARKYPVGWKWRGSRRLLSWIKTSKIHNGRIPAIKTITNCWCCKSRFCMKSKRQKKRHKSILRKHFSFTNSSGNFARKQTPTDMARYLVAKKSHLHVRTGLRKHKIGDRKFSLFFANT